MTYINAFGELLQVTLTLEQCQVYNPKTSITIKLLGPGAQQLTKTQLRRIGFAPDEADAQGT